VVFVFGGLGWAWGGFVLEDAGVRLGKRRRGRLRVRLRISFGSDERNPKL
jgi:hypothetical protein